MSEPYLENLREPTASGGTREVHVDSGDTELENDKP
jgi:hypothetical protein